MTKDEPRYLTADEAVAYARRVAAWYARRAGADPEEIAGRVLVKVARLWADGPLVAWGLLVASVRTSIADVHRDDRAAKRTPAARRLEFDAESIAERRSGEHDPRTLELRMDIDTCLARESADVRRLCGLLETMTLTEASRVMNVPRSTLAGWLASLRERMEARGLDGH